MKKLFATMAAVTFLFVNASKAGPFSLTGGQIVPLGQKGLEAGVGYPGLYGAFHLPLSEKFELAPKFAFYYGWDTHAPSVGNLLGVVMKYNLISGPALNLSFLMEPAFMFFYHPGTSIGIIIGGPGVVLSYTMEEKFHLIGGLKIPFGFLVHPDFSGIIPILFTMGAEFSVSPTMNLFMNAHIGPDIYATSGGSASEFSPNFFLGISMLL